MGMFIIATSAGHHTIHQPGTKNRHSHRPNNGHAYTRIKIDGIFGAKTNTLQRSNLAHWPKASVPMATFGQSLPSGKKRSTHTIVKARNRADVNEHQSRCRSPKYICVRLYTRLCVCV